MIKSLLEAVAKAYSAFKQGYQKELDCGELFKNFTASLDETLGEYELKYDYLCGKDSVNIDGISEGYVPNTGDTIIMDISVGKEGVWCDVCRTYFIGVVNEEQKTCYEMIYRSIKAGERVLKAGASACEIYKAVNIDYEKCGQTLIHHAGHRIGSEPLMQPQFLAEEPTPVEEGDLVTIESGSYVDFGIRLENDYYIDKDGAENLFEDLMPLRIEEYILK